jgi:hypothetical protein
LYPCTANLTKGTNRVQDFRNKMINNVGVRMGKKEKSLVNTGFIRLFYFG